MTSTRLLVLFLDGVGVGPSDPDVNPFFRARLPALREALGGGLPCLEQPSIDGPGARAFPIDAAMEMEGLPQSGTGQVALLTGRNAARILGRHFGPWPPVRLRPILEEESFLRRAVAGGARAAFANAYPAGFPDGLDRRRMGALPLAARAAGLLTRNHEALARGEAVASEIVNDGWREHLGHHDLPEISPTEAGANLAGVARGADLTFFAHYGTDFAGHRGDMAEGVSILERVDEFLSGLLSELPTDHNVLIVSDHGNLEDIRTGHTRNPALGVLLGPVSEGAQLPDSIVDVADMILAIVLG